MVAEQNFYGERKHPTTFAYAKASSNPCRPNVNRTSVDRSSPDGPARHSSVGVNYERKSCNQNFRKPYEQLQSLTSLHQVATGDPRWGELVGRSGVGSRLGLAEGFLDEGCHVDLSLVTEHDEGVLQKLAIVWSLLVILLQAVNQFGFLVFKNKRINR